MLQRVGLITWRKRVNSRIGAFFVWKKNKSAIRLVLDCSPTNQLCRSAPKSSLATPAALSHILGGEDWCRLEQEVDP
eukprot:6466610-Alexandrium_andersonii.AAC.1